MANIQFSTFKVKSSELNPVEAKAVKDTLSEKLKEYLLSKVQESDKVALANKLKNVLIDLDELKEKSISDAVNSIAFHNFILDEQAKKIMSGLSESLKSRSLKYQRFTSSFPYRSVKC